MYFDIVLIESAELNEFLVSSLMIGGENTKLSS